MQLAIAYERGESVYLHASSKTTAGVWILSEPVSVSPRGDVRELNRKIFEALNGSQTGIAHPKTWENIFEKVLVLAGVKTWGTFVKKAKCVHVRQDGEAITLIPTCIEGVDRGFVLMRESARPFTGSKDDLGLALVETFAVSTGIPKV